MVQVWRFLQATDKWKLESHLTWWQVSEKEADLLMSGTVQFKLQVSLAKYPLETGNILHRDIF